MTTISVPNPTPAAGRLALAADALGRAARRTPDFLVNVIGQKRVLARPYAGVMHFLIFWGVTIQVLGTAVNLMQMKLFTPFEITFFPRSNLYLAYELIMDLAGVAILVGVAMALFRRLALRPRTMPSRWDDYYALGLLALIPMVGFTVEALRMVAVSPPWAAWSPVGNALAGFLRGAGVVPAQAMQVHTAVMWSHAAIALALLASVPFTKMRHVVYAPLNVAFRSRQRPGTVPLVADIENAETFGVGPVNEYTTGQLLSFDACLRCGRCEDACPVNACDATFSPREIVWQLRTEMVDELVNRDAPARLVLEGAVDPDTSWKCTTCGACVMACPAFIDPPDALIDLRRYQTMSTGEVPSAVGDALRNFERQNNPWGLPADDRAVRVRDLGVRTLAPGETTDTLLYLGCAFTYDERNTRVARALVGLLQNAGVDFAVLDGEPCCGESARRLGHEYLFQEMARANLSALQQVNFRRIVTGCPHCFNTLKNEYPELGANFAVVHHTELLAELGARAGGKAGAGAAGTPGARGAAAASGQVVYHDSCYLGRYNDVYDAPRKLLDGAGVKRSELPLHGADSFCCGGGGGQMWMEIEPEHRLNNRRLDEAVAAGADVVATACPYCLLMFDDAIRSKGLGDRVRVMDVAEVMASSVGPGASAAESAAAPATGAAPGEVRT
jgi:Fe-S oxidoreductase/nitrate reductase gamma subunit